MVEIKAPPHFELRLKVRDYECDSQGVVNNANYLHYLEHTRHEFLESLGVSFQELHRQQVDAVVSRIDIQYKSSLTGTEVFISRLKIKREGIRIIFDQEIIRESDKKTCCLALVEVVVIQCGKLTRGDYFDPVLNTIP